MSDVTPVPALLAIATLIADSKSFLRFPLATRAEKSRFVSVALSVTVRMATEGDTVGTEVGVCVGEGVGTIVGVCVGAIVGVLVGPSVGASVGFAVGVDVGDGVGASEGLM
jgi:hypothetical protein